MEPPYSAMAMAMAVVAAHLRFPLSTSKFSHHRKNSRPLLFFKISPTIQTSSWTICVNSTSTSIKAEPDLVEAESDNSLNNQSRWKPITKRKVAMRVGYVGTNYRGLQIQRDSGSLITIEDELEKAILKAGGMLESNYGNLHKLGWRRSSRTDKGVHSLATVIAMKMEIPDGAWEEDPDGIALADVINRHLPYNIRIFSILPMNKRFDARNECVSRKYVYLLPAEVIGIGNASGLKEIESHVKEFRDILQLFEGRHPFHNYTIRAQYRKRSPEGLVKISRPNSLVEKGSSLESKEGQTKNGNAASKKILNKSEKRKLNLDGTSEDEEDLVVSTDDIGCGSNSSDALRVFTPSRAKWLHEPDEADRISAAHFRKILSCTCGELETISNTPYIEISIHGESFMFHQIRKMVGTAVAVKRALLAKDIIKISLSRYSRVVVPLAPSEVLVLSSNEFSPSNTLPLKNELSRLTHSTGVQGRVNDFYSNVLLPEVAHFLDPSKPVWKVWLDYLNQCSIPDIEMNELRRAWTQWQENCISRLQKTS